MVQLVDVLFRRRLFQVQSGDMSGLGRGASSPRTPVWNLGLFFHWIPETLLLLLPHFVSTISSSRD